MIRITLSTGARVDSWEEVAARFEFAVKTANPPMPVADPASVYFDAPEEFKPLVVLPIAYMSGEFDRVTETFNIMADDYALRLVAAAWALPAAVESGDWDRYGEIHAWLESLMNRGGCPSSYALMPK